MKTPRDILFQRHQAAEPRLDAIRRELVAAAADVNRRKQPVREWRFAAAPANAVRLLFLELLWPSRRIWTGLAVVWFLLVLVNFSQRDPMNSVTGKSGRPVTLILSLQTQQRWMNELLADRQPPPETDRIRNPAPKPRTEISGASMV